MQFPVEDITILIPQKPPFVLIDKLLFADGRSSRCSFIVPSAHVLLDNGRLNEGGLLENMAQTAAAGAGFIALNEDRPVKKGFIGAVKNFEVFELPFTGEELLTEAVTENEVFGMNNAKAKIACNGKLVAVCEMKIFLDSGE